jgi:hypothetical protein
MENVILENINNTNIGLFYLKNTSISLLELYFTNITSNMGGIIYGEE